MTSKNLLSLWPEAWPPEKIPEVPGMSIRTAAGGETTHFIADELPISENRSKIVVGTRPADPGELLRGPDLRYLPDWEENYRWRLKVRSAIDTDPKLQSWAMDACKSSILFYAATFVWIEDPWALDGQKHIPFVPFEFQSDLLTWLVWCHANRVDWLVEKSREMGATWVAMIFDSWLTLFYPGTTCYLTSLHEEEVDNRKTDSLIGKYRYILRHLPTWMNGGWKEESAGDKYGSVSLGHNKSTVSGQKVESTGGRSGRAFSIKADEFAHIDNAAATLEAFSSLAMSCGFISTPKGMGNEFARMAHDPAVNKKTLHWRLHPLKNEEWAKWERGKPRYHDEAVWNQEHELSYQGSVVGRVFPDLIFLPVKGTPWMHVRDDEIVQFDPAYDVTDSTDLGGSDPCATLFAQIKPAPVEMQPYTRWTLCIFAENHERGMIATDLRYMLNTKAIEKHYIYRDHIVDMRTGDQGDSSGRSWLINLADPDARDAYSKFYGRIISPGPPIFATGKRNWEMPTIDQVHQMLALPGALAINKDTCPHLIMAIQNWAYPLDKNTRQPQTDAGPKHDEWSHACKALCYLIDWVHAQFLGEQEPPTARRSDWNFSTRKRRFV